MRDTNYENYKKKSAKGLWSVVKNDKGIAIQRKRFNPDDGTDDVPTLEYFVLANLIDEQTELQKQLADITAVIKDAQLL